MGKSNKEVDQYCNQVDEIVSQMHEDDFFEAHSASRMKEMLETLIGAEERLSAFYTIQKQKMKESYDKNGGGADNKEGFELGVEVTEINYYCEIARDFISELEEMLKEKGETEEEIENPEEEYFGDLPNMRVEEPEETENQTIDFDGKVAPKHEKEAGKIVGDRAITGKRPPDVAMEAAMMKKDLMHQIEETLNPEEKTQEVPEKEEEREEERQK